MLVRLLLAGSAVAFTSFAVAAPPMTGKSVSDKAGMPFVESGDVLAWATVAVTSPAASAPSSMIVKSINYKGKLPFVESGDAKRDARINHRIFLDMIEQPAPARIADGVPVAKGRDDGPGSSDFGYSVLRNDDRVLSLAVDAEGCGAYCEHGTTHYNFDAATGRAIYAQDLFTPAGGAALLKLNVARRLAEYRKAIAALNKNAVANRKKRRIATPWPEPRPDNKPDDEEARISDAIEMYERCMEEMRAPNYGKYFTLARAAVRIGKDAVTFLHGRCSNHAMLALDEVGNQETTYKLAELAPHLSAYGKYLLMDGPQAAPRADPFRQILHGHVGQAAITLDLSERYSDGSLSARYFYDKYRTPIALSGKINGNAIVLTESESKETPKPVIRATLKGDVLEGQWIGRKTLDFRAAP